MEQRSKEWLKARQGKFTASRISELMGIRALGKTGEGYALEKAIEYFVDKDESDNFMSFDMKRGVELEPLAFAKFKEIKELEFLDVTNCGFFEYDENSGASPDGLVSDDAILEIKCPKKETFFKLVYSNEIDPKYYAQMQMQMLCAKKSKAYFFNYFVQDGEEFWHEIVVEKDEEFIKKMIGRINEAVIIRDNIIEKIKLQKQF